MTNREALTQIIEEENDVTVTNLKASKGFGINAEYIFYAYDYNDNKDPHRYTSPRLKQKMLLSEFESKKRELQLKELLDD